jgi:transposase InsO family protein
VGKITGRWLGAAQKVEILVLIQWAKEKGLSITLTCTLLMIARRRVDRWQKRWKEEGSFENRKPGPKYPLHKLLPMERKAVLEMAKEEPYADLSHRTLAVTAWDLEVFFVSFSTVYRILHSENLMGTRGISRSHNARSLPPLRKEITGPNQRWCWDISYLRTYEKWLFLYLYVLLDEYSRKVIHWLVSWHENKQEARRLLEEGFIAENILDLPEDERPEIVNDRGPQMKAKSIKTMFKDHNMPQLFARPRTPNDNPFVESLFGTVKTTPQYPGRFLDLEEANRYFDRFFPWYNTEHYHSGINYVTPEQCHQELRESIVAQRKRNLQKQRLIRKEANRSTQNPLTGSLTTLMINPFPLVPCSVIPT